jgi:Ni/Fe-hydrogenase 1 B-type cytochrome subunit
MNNPDPSHESLRAYPVWDRSVRVFHWLNVICVTALVAVGIAILNNKILGVSPDGKILLKTIHVYIGYVFVVNLLWRVTWLFIGNKYSRWKAVLPVGKNYLESLKYFIKESKTGNSPVYLGHNPVAKLMVGLLLLLLSMQAITGLVLAGTDLYMPPFGQQIVRWVVAPDNNLNDLSELKPGSKENVDPDKYAEMREFRKPFITLHYYSFYILLAAIFLHIAGVIYSELKERSGLVSAMFSGVKMFSKKPLDYDD